MKSSDQERYLGDQINRTGKIKVTIEERVAKGYGIVSEINAILDEIPLGTYRTEMGLILRQAMFVNGILYNSEGWHNGTEEDIKNLEKVDECLLRSILQSHQKVPLEFLYLETGSLPLRHIVSSRRMNYLRTLLTRNEDKFTTKKPKSRGLCGTNQRGF